MTQPPPYPGPPIEPDVSPAPPPGGAPHGVAPTRGLAIGAAIAAIVFTAFEVIEVPLAFAAQDAYLDAASQGLDSLDVWTAYDTFALPWTVVLIAVYVVTCLWLYRVRTNAEVLHPGLEHSRSKGWVWGGWVVPVVNLWFPFQVVRDVSKNPPRREPGALLGWWWTFWLLWAISSRIGPQMTGFGGEIDTEAVQALGIVEGVNAGFTVIALVLWLAVIRRIDQAQRTSTSPPDPSPVSAVA